MFNFIGRVIRYIILEVVTTFLLSVVVGSVIWYLMSIFGSNEYEYFQFVRHVFLWALAIDLVIEFIKFVGRDSNSF